MPDDTIVTPLHQPGTILDPLTEIARDGARQMLAAALLGADAPNLSPGAITRLAAGWEEEHDG